ncbi:isochorismatase family protein [Paenibacillus wulumuqiensis]|uniref:isochorismatase family protein n=1 Tax=Paenibacillus wulumuqiensis TaxID=1567107 RepID=UPI000619CB48|nr:isochorismatase family protein [Paenibacillus wulumuqiensis]
MQALLVIDVQNGIVNYGDHDFQPELIRMEQIIQDYRQAGQPVIFLRHVDERPEHPLYRGSEGGAIHPSLQPYADQVIEKSTPSAFFQTELAGVLEGLGVNHVCIVGFEAEFCCMFTSIAAYDRGYRVTLVQDATGTTNTADSYEMPGLDVRSLVGKVLHWSEVIEVLDYDQYREKYSSGHADPA